MPGIPRSGWTAKSCVESPYLTCRSCKRELTLPQSTRFWMQYNLDSGHLNFNDIRWDLDDSDGTDTEPMDIEKCKSLYRAKHSSTYVFMISRSDICDINLY